MDKASLREKALRLRSRQDSLELQALSSEIETRVLSLPEFRAAGVLASYVSKEKEVDTRGILAQALGLGKRVLVPRTDKARGFLIFSEIADLEADLAPGTFGILEPKPEALRPADLREADLILVPGLAWDERGYRLGYGKGYFDKALLGARLSAVLVGLAFEFQLFPRVPEEGHDVPVHLIVTERRVIRCRSGEASGKPRPRLSR